MKLSRGMLRYWTHIVFQVFVLLSDATSIVTEAKLQSINSYLDEVEKRQAAEISTKEEEETTKLFEHAQQAASEVRQLVLQLH